MENPENAEHEPDDRPAPTTSPDDPTHEATTPPGNPERDDDAVREAEDQLDQAGGGH
jgi:hypothetical protein